MHDTWQGNAQIRATLDLLHHTLGGDLRAVCLHGSAASGGLQPHSDIDLLGIIDRGLTGAQRAALVASLLRLSARHPAPPGGPRCLEVMLFSSPDLAADPFPARAEFVYGEWLRDGFDSGEISSPAQDPEFTLILAQAGQQAIPLFGPKIGTFLPTIPRAVIHRAMRDLLPSLLDGLQGDTRNVLLTLARMWWTASNSTFTSKDRAALWAIPRLGGEDALTLDHARRAYLGEIAEDWASRHDQAQRLAARLAQNVAD